MDTNLIIIMTLIPIISALIGWFTNFLAIKSLFRPVNKFNLLGFKIQGVIPKRKKAIINNIAEVIEEYLFSHKDILKEFQKANNVKKIKDKVAPFLEEKIVSKIPAMFQSMAAPLIKNILDTELENILYKIMDEFNGHTSKIDVKKTIIEKLNSYDISKTEKIIYRIASKEFKHIEFLGAIIGFIIGLFQVGLMILLG